MSKQVTGIGFIGTGEVSLLHAKARKSIPSLSGWRLEAGKPVLVEKPVGAIVADIEGMKATADRMGLVCVPGHNY